MKLWNNEFEIQFFTEALKNGDSPEQLFYNLDSKYYAYIPKKLWGEGKTLQSRNTKIGQYTEKWTKDLFSSIASEFNLFAVNSVICEEIGLTRRSNADLAFCTTDSQYQKPGNIKIIFEIKMSIVSNYSYSPQNGVQLIGDYKSHQGNPSFLRSDSMLKAIGKSINIRVSGNESSTIPIIILGNSPINDSYVNKVDFLKSSGVIQGFLSLNPKPTDTQFISESPNNGFKTISQVDELYNSFNEILNSKLNYFSSMISSNELGNIIALANIENSDEDKAEKFLQLIRGINHAI